METTKLSKLIEIVAREKIRGKPKAEVYRSRGFKGCDIREERDRAKQDFYRNRAYTNSPKGKHKGIK